MNIIELEIFNIGACKHALLKFNLQAAKSPLYLVHSVPKCEVISLALQLICGTEYARYSSLNKIRNKINQAKVSLQFTLPHSERRQKETAATNFEVMDHSSDSDTPCTSKQALQRAAKRREKRAILEKQRHVVTIKASRDFILNPDVITYSVDNGAIIQCSVSVFHIRFFSCTEIIFPRLMQVTYGEYCQGKWLDLLSLEFVNKHKEENVLLKQFCKLFGQQKVMQDNALCQLTTSVLTARNFLNQARLTHLISIFNDIRWLFEYMTCNEYTVYFLLPSVYGNLHDITKISQENINFDLMKTLIQLKTPNADPIEWTQAEKHIQELLLVAVQLSFGYHCQQSIIYLHSLHHLEKHQSFQFFNYSLMQSCVHKELLFEKNYLQRIFNVCSKLNICIVLEYSSGLPFYPSQSYIIDCHWLATEQEWQICVKNEEQTHQTNNEKAKTFLQKLQEAIN